MFGFSGYYISDDNDTPKTCYYHKFEEVLLFGVHTYWKCNKCDHTLKFEEIQKNHDIVKRLTWHKLPWENDEMV